MFMLHCIAAKIAIFQLWVEPGIPTEILWPIFDDILRACAWLSSHHTDADSTKQCSALPSTKVTWPINPPHPALSGGKVFTCYPRLFLLNPLHSLTYRNFRRNSEFYPRPIFLY